MTASPKQTCLNLKSFLKIFTVYEESEIIPPKDPQHQPSIRDSLTFLVQRKRFMSFHRFVFTARRWSKRNLTPSTNFLFVFLSFFIQLKPFAVSSQFLSGPAITLGAWRRSRRNLTSPIDRLAIFLFVWNTWFVCILNRRDVISVITLICKSGHLNLAPKGSIQRKWCRRSMPQRDSTY